MQFEAGALSDVFLFDRTTNHVTLISANVAGNPANGASVSPRISGNGRVVVFASTATDLDPSIVTTGTTQQIYAADTWTGFVRLVSRSAGAEASGNCSEPAVDASGLTVIFACAATNLPNGDGVTQRIYVVALSSAFFTSPISVGFTDVSDNAGTPGDGNAMSPSISGDGTVVAFASEASNLSAGVNPGERHIYLRVRSFPFPSLITPLGTTSGTQTRTALDFTGARLAFQTAAAIAVDDKNLAIDVYAHSELVSQTRRVSVRADGSELASGGRLPAISAFGGVVAFTTAQDLTVAPQQDTNGTDDVYLTVMDEDFSMPTN
jgi:hypothetical protein